MSKEIMRRRIGLGEADEIDWSRASLDSASVAAKRGREGRKESDGS